MKQKSHRLLTIKSIVVMLAVCICSIFYVWQHIVIIKLGYKIRREEERLDSLLDEKARLQSMISRMESPSNIQQCLASANLNLKQSRDPNVIRIKYS